MARDVDSFDVVMKSLEEAEAAGLVTEEDDVSQGDEAVEDTEGDTEADSDAVDDTETATEAEGEDTPEDKAAKETAKTAGTRDEYDDLLDEFGFKLPKPGQRENRQPVARVRARVKTALQKYGTKFATERTDLTGKLTAAEQELGIFRRADQLIAAGATDPAKAREYIELLSRIHPSYKAFLGDPAVSSSVKTEIASTVTDAIKALGAKPGPDLKYTDGTTGYSDDQLEKREEWLVKKATIESTAAARADLDKRMTPFEQEKRDRESTQAELGRNQTRLARLRTMWGTLFTTEEALGEKSEIIAYRKANPTVPFEDCVAAVLIPRLSAERTKIKQEVIDETNARRKKTTKVAPQQTKVVAGKPASTSSRNRRASEDAVLAALADAGL